MAEHNTNRSWFVVSSVSSSAQQGAREARGAAAAVDADLAAGERADVESGGTQFVVRFAILFDGDQTFSAEGQNVAGQRVALGIVDLDEFESARLEQFDSLYRKPWEIDHGGAFVQQADQGHQVEASRRPRSVGKRGRDHVDIFWSENRAHLRYPGGIRAIAMTD